MIKRTGRVFVGSYSQAARIAVSRTDVRKDMLGAYRKRRDYGLNRENNIGGEPIEGRCSNRGVVGGGLRRADDGGGNVARIGKGEVWRGGALGRGRAGRNPAGSDRDAGSPAAFRVGGGLAGGAIVLVIIGNGRAARIRSSWPSQQRISMVDFTVAVIVNSISALGKAIAGLTETVRGTGRNSTGVNGNTASARAGGVGFSLADGADWRRRIYRNGYIGRRRGSAGAGASESISDS